MKLLPVLAIIALGCASLPSRPNETAIVERLYVGRQIGDTGLVSDAAFKTFLDDFVTPRFGGFGVTQNTGMWKDSTGKIWREPGWVIEFILTEPNDKAIDEVSAEYKRRFAQLAVLRVLSRSMSSKPRSPTSTPRSGKARSPATHSLTRTSNASTPTTRRAPRSMRSSS